MRRGFCMKKSRFLNNQILAILKQAEVDTSVPELCREHGISSALSGRYNKYFISKI
jgi:putative transposase